MTHITFGVSASSIITNMHVKQNAIDFGAEYPDTAKEMERFFYFEVSPGGADSLQEAMRLQSEMHDLFQKAGSLLCKWN